MPRYIGLDLHRDYVVGCEFTPGADPGQQEKHFRYPTTPDGWSRVFTHLGGDALVAIEVTGNAFNVYDSLLGHAQEVLVANPLAMKRLGSGKHTDKEDSARLAKMLALGTLPTVWVPPQPVREVRRLLGARERMLSMRTAAVNQAKAVLRRRGIASGRMRHDPSVLKELPPDERILYTAALSQVASLDKTIHDLEAEIALRLKDDEAFGHLLTITGVGATTAAIVWATIGDPGRFKTGKQVARYAGLDPSVMQSGETDRRGRISKNGSRRLRTALVEVAHTIGRLEQGYLGMWYRARASQKGKAKTAVALARKLVVVAWRLMLRGEDYRTVRTDRFEVKRKEVERLAGERADWDALADKVTKAFTSRARRGQIGRKGPARKAG